MWRDAALRLLALLWLGLIGLGFVAWERYDTTPGESAAAAGGPGQRSTLVMFLHPHCPCSRASLNELADLLGGPHPPVSVRVVFVRPKGVPTGWEKTALWDAAAGLPGVVPTCDEGGAEARRAGATTSGHVVLFDSAGERAFGGGISRARGRQGGGPGRRAVEVIWAGRDPGVREFPVYGCPLLTAESCSDETGNGACPR